MNIAAFLFLLAFFLSPFYFFSSGYPQPSSVIFLLFSCWIFFVFRGRFSFSNAREVWLLFLFYFWVFFVNLFWGIQRQSYEFLLFPAYLSFNVSVFIAAVAFLSRKERWRELVCRGIFFVVIVLALLWALGLGRYDFNPRYNGFFNDPNQMAFWVLCALAIYLLMSRDGLVLKSALLFFAVFLIFLTMSRSAVVGLLAMSIGAFWEVLKGSSGSSKKYFGIVLLFVFGFFSVTYFSNLDQVDAVVSRFQEISVDDQLDTRGYGRIRDFPEYLFLGSGQGDDQRFGSRYEIHSTWAAFLFYYGLVGLFIFLAFIYSMLRRLGMGHRLVALGPLVYGFSTFGARSTIFWIFCAALVCLAEMRRNE